MAHCKYCDHLVSPNARRCPKCGENDPAASSYIGDDNLGCLKWGFIIILILTAVLIWIPEIFHFHYE
jgi:hypothetical protein